MDLNLITNFNYNYYILLLITDEIVLNIKVTVQAVLGSKYFCKM